jgi:hypothetical protein
MVKATTYPYAVERVKRLRAGQAQGALQERGVPQERGRLLRILSEQALELIARPLQRVLDRVREVLQRADGDALLRRVLGRAVRLRQERHYHLSNYKELAGTESVEISVQYHIRV